MFALGSWNDELARGPNFGKCSQVTTTGGKDGFHKRVTSHQNMSRSRTHGARTCACESLCVPVFFTACPEASPSEADTVSKHKPK